MRLHLISDGTPQGTYVVNKETGERVENLTAVQYAMHKHVAPTLRIEVTDATADIEAEGYVTE